VPERAWEYPEPPMNFFGHAALAASELAPSAGRPSQLALLCLGAMLPDFVGMLRLGAPELRDADLARGVAFHHRTDHAFHDLPSFQGLSRRTFAWLSQRELPRGPARAVAHIGIEMLLDEVLAQAPAARAAYLAALVVPLEGALSFEQARDLERLEALRGALNERASSVPVEPEVMALRIRRTLEPRPRLATDDAGQALLGEWVRAARPWVAAAAPELLASLRAQLANEPGPE
jgi:hypothetical protein